MSGKGEADRIRYFYGMDGKGGWTGFDIFIEWAENEAARFNL